MTVIGLGYFGIGASDIAAWRVYAGEVLGCQVVDREDGSLHLRLDERAWRIAIEPAPEDDVSFVGWEVEGPAALAALAQRLRDGGHPVSEDAMLADRRGVCGLIRFTDPRGVACEVFWGATERNDLAFVSPTGTKGFVTGDQGLGHVVLSTTDAAGLQKFYADFLGFRVSDYIFDPRLGSDKIVQVTFMHGNDRHHSIAFAAVPAPKKLLHFMLQTESLDDVGRALDRVHAFDVPLALALGRHVNDHMVSFYAWTPSGFEVEYGWGARTLDDATWTVVRHERISSWGHHTINPPGTVPNWKPRTSEKQKP